MLGRRLLKPGTFKIKTPACVAFIHLFSNAAIVEYLKMKKLHINLLRLLEQQSDEKT